MSEKFTYEMSRVIKRTSHTNVYMTADASPVIHQVIHGWLILGTIGRLAKPHDRLKCQWHGRASAEEFPDSTVRPLGTTALSACKIFFDTYFPCTVKILLTYFFCKQWCTKCFKTHNSCLNYKILEIKIWI